jgi:potassium large conductance calcium-activated channel subfamily M alpha protein 1
MSKPFASGEIYVSSLIDSLMCQTYYNPKMSEILEQLILGSANTSEKITKNMQALNLS